MHQAAQECGFADAPQASDARKNPATEVLLKPTVAFCRIFNMQQFWETALERNAEEDVFVEPAEVASEGKLAFEQGL